MKRHVNANVIFFHITSFIYRTIYTCALNNRGGVEIDLTVTPVENGVKEINDPTFKGRGLIVNATYVNVIFINILYLFLHLRWLLRILLHFWRCVKLSLNITHA